MLINYFFYVFTGLLLFTAPAYAGMNASASVDIRPLPEKVEHAISPATKPSEEKPTEGGFIFYNRQLISATYGKNRQVLLTFDDGPNPNTTPLVLDVLKRRGLKAVFFLVGMNVRKYPELVRRIHNEGHTVGNHTYYHIFLPHYGSERITREIRETNGLIEKITGVRPNLFRPPYGGVNQSALETLRKEGMNVMLWNVDPGDWRNRSMTRTVENLKRQMQLSHGGRGGIVLLHDTLPSTAHALEPFLVALTQEGLLPQPYGVSVAKASSGPRAYWANKGPVLLRRLITRTLAFNPDILQRPYLASLLKPQAKKEISPLAILKAKKTGGFLKLLLTRNF